MQCTNGTSTPSQRDLKRFPLQTYPSPAASSATPSEAGSSIYSNVKVNTVRKTKSKNSRASPESNSSSGGSCHHPTAVSSLSKSVPNLVPAKPDDSCGGDRQPDDSFSFLDPDKRMKVPDDTLKKIQKQALLDYFERQSKGGAGNGANDHDSGFYSPTHQNHGTTPGVNSRTSERPSSRKSDHSHRASVGSLLEGMITPMATTPSGSNPRHSISSLRSNGSSIKASSNNSSQNKEAAIKVSAISRI